MATRSGCIWLWHWSWKSQAHNFTRSGITHRPSEKSELEEHKPLGRQRMEPLVFLVRALGIPVYQRPKSPGERTTRQKQDKAWVCLNSSTSPVRLLLCFILSLRLKNLNRMAEYCHMHTGHSWRKPDPCFLGETIWRCWVCPSVLKWHSEKSYTEAWFSLGYYHFLWKEKNIRNKSIHYGVKPSSSDLDKNVKIGQHKMRRNFSSHVGILQTKQRKY